MNSSKEKPEENENSQYSIRTYKQGDEKELSELFTSTAYADPLSDWIWKYRSSPYSDSSLIIVALSKDKVVGGTHAQKRKLKIDNNLIIESSIGSGLMVSEDHRKRGIATKLMTQLRKNLRSKGVKLHYSVPEEWAFKQVYSKRYALMLGPQLHLNFRYSKRLIKNSLEQKLIRVNKKIQKDKELQKKVKKLDLNIKFNISSFPPTNFLLTTKEGKFITLEAESKKPDITITTRALPNSLTSLLSMILRRNLKTKGLIRNSLKLRKSWRFLRELSSI